MRFILFIPPSGCIVIFWGIEARLKHAEQQTYRSYQLLLLLLLFGIFFECVLCPVGNEIGKYEQRCLPNHSWIVLLKLYVTRTQTAIVDMYIYNIPTTFVCLCVRKRSVFLAFFFPSRLFWQKARTLIHENTCSIASDNTKTAYLPI